jgi:hypothetical protein
MDKGQTGAATESRTRLFAMARRRSTDELQPHGAFGRARTACSRRTRTRPDPSGEGMRAESGGRTRADGSLSSAPLPLGYLGAGAAGLEPADLLNQSQACCQLHHAPLATNRRRESNPLDLFGRQGCNRYISSAWQCVGRAGIEPAFSALRTQRDHHYSNGPWCPTRESNPACPGLQPGAPPLAQDGHAWIHGDSNPEPSVCHTDALPVAPRTHTSGRHDSNVRLLRPKRSALTKLSYDPKRPGVAAGASMLSTVELTKNDFRPAGRTAWAVGLEPTTGRFGDGSSTVLSYAHIVLCHNEEAALSRVRVGGSRSASLSRSASRRPPPAHRRGGASARSRAWSHRRPASAGSAC